MANVHPDNRNFAERHRFKIQTLAFVAMLVLPFLLYFAAQAQQDVLVNILIGLMALAMLTVVWIS